MAPTAVEVQEQETELRASQIDQKIKLTGAKTEALGRSSATVEQVGQYRNVYGSNIKLSEDGRYLEIQEDEKEALSYPEWAPTWDIQEHQAPYEEVEFEDKAALADPSFANLFRDEAIERNDLTPKFGTEIKNLQLSSLSDEQKNELALFVAKRGFAVFRKQDLAAKGPEFAVKYGEYFGQLHSHPASGAPKGESRIHLVYKGKNVTPSSTYLKNRINSVTWHSDVTYELQPPSITFLGILDGPKTGGDTAFLDTVEAYNRLSPKFRAFLETLTARHSGVEQAQSARAAGGHVRREPVTHEHPVVRRIPVTGDKALYVNPQFTRDIVGFKTEESENITKFLYDFLSTSIDLQARAKWEPDTVVVWDNRRALHSALFDWESSEVREVFRVANRAEIPTL